jgi:hypothetical protein
MLNSYLNNTSLHETVCITVRTGTVAKTLIWMMEEEVEGLKGLYQYLIDFWVPEQQKEMPLNEMATVTCWSTLNLHVGFVCLTFTCTMLMEQKLSDVFPCPQSVVRYYSFLPMMAQKEQSSFRLRQESRNSLERLETCSLFM